MTWDKLIARMKQVEGWQVNMENGTVTITFYIPVLQGNVTATFTPEQLEDAQAYYEGYTA